MATAESPSPCSDDVVHDTTDADIVSTASTVDSNPKPDLVDILMKSIIENAISDSDNTSTGQSQTSKLKMLNIVLDGPPGSGKTSLKRILLGKSAYPLLESLSCMDSDKFVSIQLLQRTKDKLEEITDDDIYKLLAAKAAKCFESQSSDNQPQIMSSLANMTTTIDSTNESSLFALQIYDKIKNSINQKLANLNYPTAANLSLSYKWYRLIDFHRLPQLNDMLPHLFHGPTFQIVCLKLTDNLEDCPEIYYILNGQKVILPEALRLTNLQYIERACQTAASCRTASKVLIVGTHRDKLEDHASKLQMLNQQLSKTFKKYEDVLQPAILDLNVVTEDDDERKSSLAQLHHHIDFASSRLAKPLSAHFEWLIMFHLSILSMGGVVSLEHWLTIGNALGFDNDSIIKALTSFKESDLLLYFPTDVPDLALTKVDPIFERLSKFMMDTLVQTPADTLSIRDYDTLKQKGIFTVAFFDEILPVDDTVATSKSWSDSSFDNNQLLKMLVCLNLVVQLENEKYFLPNALSYCSNVAIVDSSQYVSCGFALGSRNGETCVLPRSFFLTTVTMLIASLKGETSNFSFQLRKDSQQHRNFIQIYDTGNKIPGVVMLIDKTSWIEVNIKKDNSHHCPVVHKAVKMAIKAAKEHLKHSDEFDIEEVFPCAIDGHNDHHCVLTKDRKDYTCSEVTECSGHVTNDMKLWIKDDGMQDKIINAFKAADNQFQGIAFVISGDAVGAKKDELKMSSVFQDHLNFAEYHVSSASKTEIMDLILAAKEFDYPIFCEYIAFYYSGHGGIEGGIEDGKPFLLPKHKSLEDKVFIEEDILEPFQSCDARFKSRACDRRAKYLFFFDCCLLSSADSSTESHSSVASTKHFKNTNSNSIIAYATAIGSEAQGENRVGGTWTKHLSECLKTGGNKSFDEILSSTCNAMVQEAAENIVVQKPFLVGKRNLSKKIFLSHKPSCIWLSSNQVPQVTEVKGLGNPETKGPGNPAVKGASGMIIIERAEWNKRFERAQMQTQIECRIGEPLSKFVVLSDGNYDDCDIKVDVGYCKSLTLQMKNTYVYDFEYKDRTKKNKKKKSRKW